MASLQHADPLIIKLHNYKKDGTKFQCLFALHPVLGIGNEYKYQIGLQIDFTMTPDVTRQLLLMETLLRYIPNTITGDGPEDALRTLPTNIMGDGLLFPFVTIDPSEMKTAAAAPAGGGNNHNLTNYCITYRLKDT